MNTKHSVTWYCMVVTLFNVIGAAFWLYTDPFNSSYIGFYAMAAIGWSFLSLAVYGKTEAQFRSAEYRKWQEEYEEVNTYLIEAVRYLRDTFNEDDLQQFVKGGEKVWESVGRLVENWRWLREQVYKQ